MKAAIGPKNEDSRLTNDCWSKVEIADKYEDHCSEMLDLLEEYADMWDRNLRDIKIANTALNWPTKLCA